ncbi:MAG: hypothetical protein JWN07_843 [Hyphomicrobiales bacterium]|nr:hypothetical protein [Hyphomicrobiales bacterium]
MANLSESDLRIIIGDDFKKKLNSVSVISESATVEENMAARKKHSQQLTDLRFSFGALAFTGAALTFGALYSGAGFMSVQGELGLAAVLGGLIGIVVTTMKRRTVDLEMNAARV